MRAATLATTGAARRHLRITGDLLALLIGICALVHAAQAGATSSPSSPELQIRDKALAMLGTEYELGRNDDAATDCSGFVQQIFASAGITLPRTTRELLHTGVPVPRTQVRAGDLMIYRWNARHLHVALALDRDHIVHASPRAGEVVLTPIDADWRRRLIAVRRVLQP